MAVVFSKAEIDRMKASVLPSTENISSLLRKADLKQKSENRLKNWPNTLDALRKKKESFLKDREEQDEQRRQEIDKEEAAIRGAARTESIRKANELLYEQTDKMKMLRSQQLYADVIDTRYHQIDEKERKKKEQNEFEKGFHLTLLEQIKKGEEDEVSKANFRKQQVNIVKLTRQQQLDEVNRKKQAELQLNLETGLRMKEEAKKRLEEDIVDKDLKQKKIKEGNLNALAANKELKLMKEDILAKEKIDEINRIEEKEVIENRKKNLKDLEKTRFDKAQITRQKMIEAAMKKLSEVQNKEEEILNKQADEIRDREDKQHDIKQLKTKQNWDSIVETRTKQILSKSEIEKKKKEDDEIIAKKLILKSIKDTEIETLQQKEKRSNDILLKKQLHQEAEEKRKKKEIEKILEIQERKLLIAANNDDTLFRDICKKEIQHNVEVGKPVYTLLKALEFKPTDLMQAKLIKQPPREKKTA